MARRLPEVIVIGAPRSGTTSFSHWMAASKEFVAPSRKEIHYFDFHYHRGEHWYRAFFPIRGGRSSFDASPSYMASPVAATRAVELVPNARIVALLRNPADRAWSHYRLRKSVGTESRGPREAFEGQLNSEGVALAVADRPADIPILTCGLYADQLKLWMDAYGKERVMVLSSEEFYGSHDAVEGVARFVGMTGHVPPVPKTNAAPPLQAPPDLAERLANYYSKPNERLFDLIGREFAW